MRNTIRCLGLLISVYLICAPVEAQMYPDRDYNYQNQNPDWGGWRQDRQQPQAMPVPHGRGYPGAGQPSANLQYDPRDAEAILRDQMSRGMEQVQAPPARGRQQQAPQEIYDASYYGHRISDENEVRAVMGEARQIGATIRKRNGKSFVVIDKRNFQFYLYDANGKLLRIGPVAIGKGKTHVGAFETPVGIFPIRTKTAVDDWIRPDWYFIEENEPIPQRWEDRRVPGFFRYKLVFDGTRYIHYAEATGGRLTHGCLGLDWEDAEAVFHTMEVGSYCIVLDESLLMRLARGEFPMKQPAQPKATPTASNTVTAKADARESPKQDRTFGSMW